MENLTIASLPKLHVLQKACETLVVINTVEVARIFNVNDRKKLLTETQHATEMVETIRDIIKNAKSNASNPKS